MHIAIFAETFLPKWDGITNTLCHLLDHLAARGHPAIVFAPEGAPSHYAAATVHGLRGFRFPLYPDLKLALPPLAVSPELAAFRPDLVHLASPVSLGLAGLRQARALGVPLVASYHTDVPGYATLYGLDLFREPLWKYFRWVHNQAALTLCPSCYTEAQLKAHGFERLRVWGRGVDSQRFTPAKRTDEWRSRLTGGQTGTPLLLYVGRLAAEKRVDWLRAVLASLPGTRLAVVGDGPLRTELENAFADLPVVFTGYLQGEDLACAYAAADIFAFPSANETFGNVVLEAMSSGLPVIAPRSGGLLDHVQHGHNGLLFGAGQPADLVAQTRRLVHDSALRLRLGAAARAHAVTQSWERILDGLLDDYAAIIAQHGGLPALPATRSCLPRRQFARQEYSSHG